MSGDGREAVYWTGECVAPAAPRDERSTVSDVYTVNASPRHSFSPPSRLFEEPPASEPAVFTSELSPGVCWLVLMASGGSELRCGQPRVPATTAALIFVALALTLHQIGDQMVPSRGVQFCKTGKVRGRSSVEGCGCSDGVM